MRGLLLTPKIVGMPKQTLAAGTVIKYYGIPASLVKDTAVDCKADLSKVPDFFKLSQMVGAEGGKKRAEGLSNKRRSEIASMGGKAKARKQAESLEVDGFDITKIKEFLKTHKAPETFKDWLLIAKTKAWKELMKGFKA